MRIVIIGLGGIGSEVCDKIIRFVAYYNNGIYQNSNIVLVDGDEYEPKNKTRQSFIHYGYKSVSKINELISKFEDAHLSYIPVKEYITDRNVSTYIKENDIVFLCVDNHKTRKIVSDYCSTLNDVLLISGGNELYDGNAQLYKRKEGINVTPPLTMYHPEIENPVDKHPGEMSCEELAKSEPQLLFVNAGVANLMCQLFFNSFIRDEHNYSEVYIDIITMNTKSYHRSTEISNKAKAA